jgi:hypothetical protein
MKCVSSSFLQLTRKLQFPYQLLQSSLSGVMIVGLKTLLNALAAPDRLPVLIGNSGVGKSSLAQAGVLAALKRQAWPAEAGAPSAWPPVFQNSRQWCFLSLKPGTDPLKALVECFLDTWQFAATDPERVRQQHGWIDLLQDGKATLSDLIEATERRRKDPRNLWTTRNLLPFFIEFDNRVFDRFSAAESGKIGVHVCPGGDVDSVHSAHVPHEELLKHLFKLNAGYFQLQMASERDRDSAYKQVGKYLCEDAKGVPQMAHTVAEEDGRAHNQKNFVSFHNLSRCEERLAHSVFCTAICDGKSPHSVHA